MIEEHSLFDRFAANSVRCLNEVSSQGELADKRPVKKASMDFVFRTYNIWICFYLYVQHPSGVNITNSNSSLDKEQNFYMRKVKKHS